MFFIDLNTLVLAGTCNAVQSSSEVAIRRCEKINWFLYRADYLMNERDWNLASPNTKADVLDGLVKYILFEKTARTRKVEKGSCIKHLSNSSCLRRARFMV